MLDSEIKISIDAMGGDNTTKVTVPSSLAILKEYPNISLILVGYEDKILEEIKNCNSFVDNFAGRLQIHHSEEHIEMDESPAFAFRKKRKSSMRIALNLLKTGTVDACVSAGNTGALMAISKFLIKTIKGVDRPAICTALPTYSGVTQALDLGANIDSSPANLCEFAVMGSVLAQCIDGKESPRVGLLNIGEEENKGLVRTKNAGLMLDKTDLNYVGFVEGGAFYSGEVDVIVCDGYEGNVALKSSESLAKMIAFQLRAAFNHSLLSKLCGLLAIHVLKQFKKKIDPRNYNGASLLGLRKVVIKSHGGADEIAFKHAIVVAIAEVKQRVPQKIEKVLNLQLRNFIEKV